MGVRKLSAVPAGTRSLQGSRAVSAAVSRVEEVLQELRAIVP